MYTDFDLWSWDTVQSYLPSFSILGNARMIQVSSLCVFIWGCVRMVLGLIEPEWYERLNNNAKKRNFLVGAMIGFGFKFFTIPSCAVAAWVTLPEDDVAGIHPSMNVHQQICWGSRGTVTILELMHFAQNRELVLHHVLILVGMAIIGIYNGPHRGFDLALGALFSEIPNSCFMIFKEFGMLSDYPTLDWVLPVSSAILGFVFRIPAIILAMAMVPASGLQGGPANVIWIAYLFYFAYVLNITWRRLKRAKVWRVVGDRDFCLRFHTCLVLSSTSFYAGLATMGTQVAGLALYSFLYSTATRCDLINVAYLSVPAVLAALFAYCVVFRWTRIWYARFKEPITTARSPIARKFKAPPLGMVGRWIFGAWMVYIVVLTTLNETPEIHNKGLSPAQIVARQPVFCGLILSWEFWLSTTSVWVLSTIGVHFAQDNSECIGEPDGITSHDEKAYRQR